jgi:acyl carrier protein
MDQTSHRRIFNIIKGVTNVDPATLDAEKNLREQVNLDSMQFVAVLARIEGEFNIELPISAMEAQTLADFMAVVDAELSKTGTSAT